MATGVAQCAELVWQLRGTAAGVNYNVVWASLGRPVDVIALLRRQGNRDGYYIGGSDAAGIVWAVGDAVRDTRVGDEVILAVAQWDERAADIRLGADPTTSDSMRVWATRRATEGWPSSRSSRSTRPTPSLLECPGRTGSGGPARADRVEVDLARLMMQKAAFLSDAGDDLAAGEAANMAEYAAAEAAVKAVDQARADPRRQRPHRGIPARRAAHRGQARADRPGEPGDAPQLRRAAQPGFPPVLLTSDGLTGAGRCPLPPSRPWIPANLDSRE